LLAAGIGCIANWVRNRTLHCGITGPIFLLGSTTFLVAGMQIIHVNVHLVSLPDFHRKRNCLPAGVSVGKALGLMSRTAVYID
jgi:hypothetical protein